VRIPPTSTTTQDPGSGKPVTLIHGWPLSGRSGTQICRKLNLVEKDSKLFPHPIPTTIMKRTASAVWQGDLKKGQGTLSTQSGVFNKTQYSFATRFENGIGTNPEELIAAAHAGCFAMSLSKFLGNAGFTPEELSTRATLTRLLERLAPKV
jgi:OsmC-like protein